MLQNLTAKSQVIQLYVICVCACIYKYRQSDGAFNIVSSCAIFRSVPFTATTTTTTRRDETNWNKNFHNYDDLFRYFVFPSLQYDSFGKLNFHQDCVAAVKAFTCKAFSHRLAHILCYTAKPQTIFEVLVVLPKVAHTYGVTPYGQI